MLGDRIRTERERLGLSQTDFARVAGDTKQTVFSWETGKTAPSGIQLAALAEKGADVLYIITGTRAIASLTHEEAALLDNYRAASEDGRRALRATGSALAQPPQSGDDRLDRAG